MSPWRALGNLLIILGLMLAFMTWLRPHLHPGSQEATPPFPTPANPVSSVKLLVKGFNAPLDEESLGTSPQDEPPVATSTPTTQLTKIPSIIEPTPVTVERAPPATRLVIPTLAIDAPVVEVAITNNTWDVSGLTYEIAHLGGTANPGEKNNMVLAGHVTLKRGAGPFLHLESLEPGDMAIVYAEEQAYTYRVMSKRYVGLTDVSVAYPTSDPILTLLTCTNWDAENRTYIERVAMIAELVKEGAP